ncbi:MAG TPA: SusC/RagA family TonB-linked outer membrane protein [Gemmatimonadaceae bacterium]|nr:SusC/RagA family TonB-linked outer membrane protein [Gemmatimonadaceae bacterium]
MALSRCLRPALLAGLVWAVRLGAQDATGTIAGRVVDGPTQAPLGDVAVVIEGTQRGASTRDDGTFTLSAVPAGAHRVRASRIGYGAVTQDVAVMAGATARVEFVLQPLAISLGEMVTVGYGTQRRQAITGSVATVDADAANVGVVANVNQMIQGRAAGVNIISNNGEPGAGAQIRVRGGTSISASNEPLYVIDGVPINNTDTESRGIGISGNSPSLPRSPLTMLNPSDIASITILKDASSTAIYGSRGANGVILIETKKGTPGGSTVEYDGYTSMAQPAGYLDVLNGNDYRAFVTAEVAAGRLAPERIAALGTENTDWAREVTRNAYTQNHNVSFSGGSEITRYRASVNYMDQQGVVLDNGFRRLQGRLNGTHNVLDSRLRLSLNLTASNVKNDYLAFDNTGGFEGAVFTNVAMFNPTRPVFVTDAVTGARVYYETGTGVQSLRNPVALAEQINDVGNTNRVLGNVQAEMDLLPGLTGTVNFGADVTGGTRRTYFPKANPVGAQFNGLARQANRDNSSVTLQTLLTYRREFADVHSFDIVGGYEFSEYRTDEFSTTAENFPTDAYGFDNLGSAGRTRTPFSFVTESRLVSFLSRANYSFREKYFVTGVLRRDGSSRFGTGNKWAVFPAISAAWRVSQEPFFADAPLGLSDLRLRAGWGLQGNPAVPPYASLLVLGDTTGGSRYAFGDSPIVGVAPLSNPNPSLKWEETSQVNVAVDYGFLNDRFTGSLEYYIKNTTDLLLRVPVPQPAPVRDRIENIGEVRNHGVEFSLDARVLERPTLSWMAGLVFAAERNEVRELGSHTSISTGGISGQGQSDQYAQRIRRGLPIGSFVGAEYVGVDAQGRQLFNDYDASGNIVGTTRSPSGEDFRVIGDANPDFSLGLRSQATIGKLDASFLIRSEVGQDVFNNTALVYSTKTNALQDRNFMRDALTDEIALGQPAIYSDRWVEDGSFVRLQNVTVGYTFDLPGVAGGVRNTRIYLSGDNLLLLSGYSGIDPEVHTEAGLASRGIDYLTYPRPRTFTAGIRLGF